MRNLSSNLIACRHLYRLVTTAFPSNAPRGALSLEHIPSSDGSFPELCVTHRSIAIPCSTRFATAAISNCRQAVAVEIQRCRDREKYIPSLSNHLQRPPSPNAPKSLEAHVTITPVSAACPNAGSAKETGGQSHGNKQANRGQSSQRSKEHRTKN